MTLFTQYFNKVARFLHDFNYKHDFFHAQKYFGDARNRARKHDKIFFLISNPVLNYLKIPTIY